MKFEELRFVRCAEQQMPARQCILLGPDGKNNLLGKLGRSDVT